MYEKNTTGKAVLSNDKGVVNINKDTLRRALLKWVTVRAYTVFQTNSASYSQRDGK